MNHAYGHLFNVNWKNTNALKLKTTLRNARGVPNS